MSYKAEVIIKLTKYEWSHTSKSIFLFLEIFQVVLIKVFQFYLFFLYYWCSEFFCIFIFIYICQLITCVSWSFSCEWIFFFCITKTLTFLNKIKKRNSLFYFNFHLPAKNFSRIFVLIVFRLTFKKKKSHNSLSF